jgi:flagellar hook-length control protein FliK
VMARVVAHSGEATQALQQSAGDLRRALAEQGVKLLGLDIGQSGGERAAGRSGGDAGSQSRSGGESAGAGTGADGTGSETSTNDAIQLPNGVLVDVLA